MAGHLKSQSYGKHRVRVSKIIRPREAAANQEQHEFVEATVNIELQGEFDAAYTDADNRGVIATDTCKNTVYALAKDNSLQSIESFGLTIANYFIDQFAHVDSCHVSLAERVWARLGDSPHAFLATGQMTPTATVQLKRGEQPAVQAGVEHLLVAKTTESGFSDFHQSEFRTLADTDDRIFATELSGSWTYASGEADFTTSRATVMNTLLGKFADHFSHSVQETLYLMAQSALQKCPAIAEISLTMPNKHHILADLAPFGRENDNEVFVVTDEPYGYISAIVARN